MSKTNDTGHGRNVVNSEMMITYLTGYGALYNPSNASIQLNSLTEKAAAARVINEQVNDLIAKNSNAIAARDLAFAPLKSLSTRILNSVRASNVSQQVLDNAVSNNRKIHGQRATPKLTEEEKNELAASGTIVNQKTAAQLSYDNLIDSFDKQIKVLATIPQYAPNEVDLQLPTLTALYNDLLQKNRDVVANNAQLSTLRLNRDKILYDAETGLVALALDVKNYVKSVFGANSAEYKQISGITFKKVKV
ncbi:hypothetical protein [Pedobacter miscanthi]|uniref:Uncharacterized protein n=1 Tax=Pedobacter miscanthi TaxID=2259170 RepID=A0A366KMQ8_9SPHI|nr:hypothetical protein [Pedobacter miscanthi]RBQ02935.1 hypothetical protein DRW42_24425 [Pedobacter miscanthi]